MWLEISPDSPLAMRHVFSRPFCVGGSEYWSIDTIFNSCFFVQHNCFERSKLIAEDVEYAFFPDRVQGMIKDLEENRNMKPTTQWILSQYDIMVTVLTHVAFVATSDISQEFDYIFRNYGENVDFIVVSSGADRVWQSGYKPGRVPEICLPSPGSNLYGLALKRVYEKLVANRFETDLVLEDLLFKVCLEKSRYRKTVVVISDSLLRHLQFVDGGSVFYCGGKTYGQMAELLKERFVNVLDSAYIILMLGTNDSQRSQSKWEKSLKKMYKLLKPVKDHPEIKVIVNTGISLPAWTTVGVHGDFLASKWQSFLSAGNVYFCRWDEICPENVFLDGQGNPNFYYLHGDNAHPNLHGVRAMWQRWRGMIPDHNFKCVKIGVGNDMYVAGKIGVDY